MKESAMTQTLAYFSAPGATPYFPGAAFILAASLNATGLLLLVLAAVSGYLIFWDLSRRGWETLSGKNEAPVVSPLAR